jgi:hypothetical protein
MAVGLLVMAEHMAGPRLRMEDALHPPEVAEQPHPVAVDMRPQAAEATVVAEAEAAVTVAEDITNIKTLWQGKAALCGRLFCFCSC